MSANKEWQYQRGVHIEGARRPLPLFKEYLHQGYYPFGADPDFPLELSQVITRTLEVDIPQFANMSAATGRKLKQLMEVVGKSKSGAVTGAAFR